MCLLFHKYGKWERYKVEVKEGSIWENVKDTGWLTQIRERRKWRECGTVQDRKVR